jgi:16S rRNA processing protein RimM
VQLVVGRIAKAHGISGEVSVEVRTDDPDHRFAVGAKLDTEPAERGPLTVDGTRWHSGRLLVRFTGVADRTAAEGLRATLLVADSSTSAPPDEAEEFWDHDLVGLTARTATGEVLGTLTDVLHPPGPDTLVITTPAGRELLVPFVAAIVPTVDIGSREVVVNPPDGLFDL